jgi:ribose/xylose/arabinose/galactoside ABC-type transport system permease subunit
MDRIDREPHRKLDVRDVRYRDGLLIGDNQNVARLVGINVEAEKIRLFTLMGALGATAGVLVTLENRNFSTTRARASF